MTVSLPRVLLVATGAAARALEEPVTAALDGGVRFVQLRVATGEDDARVRSTLDRLRRFAGRGTIWCVNGRPALARAARTGLHLPAARPGVGPPRPAVLGRSAHDEREVAAAVAERVDYVVLGTVFPTGSKPGGPTLGRSGLRRLVDRAGRIPSFAIGGLRPRRAAGVLADGCYGVAVSSFILAAPDPASAARRLVEAVESAAGGVH